MSSSRHWGSPDRCTPTSRRVVRVADHARGRGDRRQPADRVVAALLGQTVGARRERLFNPGRAEGTRLPAGFSLTSCLPGLCFTSCLPGSFLQRRRPPASRAPPARPAAMRNQARQTRALLPSGTSCRSKNPPLTHGDPAEAGPPGPSQPSRVHPVKQRAGAMRTRTGARPSSTSCASPLRCICAQLRSHPGGGRHPQTRPTSPPPCGIARKKPPKWRSATPPRIPPLPPPARLRSCPSVQQPLTRTRTRAPSAGARIGSASVDLVVRRQPAPTASARQEPAQTAWASSPILLPRLSPCDIALP
jgi:hypothetical protein